MAELQLGKVQGKLDLLNASAKELENTLTNVLSLFERIDELTQQPRKSPSSLKDAIAKAAEESLTANVKPGEKYQKKGELSYEQFKTNAQVNVSAFLWNVLKEVAHSEMAATPDGIKAIAEIATALGHYVN